jgi:hypothetical protein
MMHQYAVVMLISALWAGCVYKVEADTGEACTASDTACGAAGGGGGGGSGSGSANVGGNDASGNDASGTGEGGAADSGSDGATGAEDPPPPAADFSWFTGVRTFSIDAYGDTWDCSGDAVPEEGRRISEGTAHDEAAALCPSCALIYEVRPSAEAACEGWVPLPNPSVLLLDLDEGAAKVYSLTESRGEYSLVTLDELADFDGFDLRYTHSADWSYGSTLSVTGELRFPELPRD